MDIDTYFINGDECGENARSRGMIAHADSRRDSHA
jgi:hypothetical protein